MTLSYTRFVYATAAFAILLALISWLAGFFDDKIDPTLLDRRAVVLEDDQLYAVGTAVIEVVESAPATITARDETIISSRILARIDAIRVRPGDNVDKGDILVELEQADLRARVGQARDQVSSVSAQLEDARLRFERIDQLFRNGDAAQAEVDKANAAFESLSAQLASAEESLSEAQVVLGYSTIRAPISGRIIERLAEPGDTASPGTGLLSLYDPLSLRAEASLRESLALRLEIGEEIRIEIESLDTRIIGTIAEIVPAADPASRSFVTRANLSYNPAFMPGIFARFIVPVETERVVLVPSRLISTVGELDFVNIYRDAVVSRRFVRLGRHQGDDLVEVIAGLEEGDMIVADPDLL